MIKPPNSSAKLVWIYGTICGVCFGIIWLISQSLVPSNAIGHALSGGIICGSFWMVGMLASKKVGLVRTGMQAGLVAGLTAGIVIGTVSLLVPRPSFSMAVVVVVALSIIAGAAIGHMGGLTGYRRYNGENNLGRVHESLPDPQDDNN